jgi:hypothetical protein
MNVLKLMKSRGKRRVEGRFRCVGVSLVGKSGRSTKFLRVDGKP